MTGRKDRDWNGFYNDWDGDATDGDSKTNRTTVFSSKEDRLFYVYGDINARNCADVAYDISQINIEDDDKDKKRKISRENLLKSTSIRLEGEYTTCCYKIRY